MCLNQLGEDQAFGWRAGGRGTAEHNSQKINQTKDKAIINSWEVETI